MQWGDGLKSIDVNIDEIIKRGCWKNQKNFFIFYDKEITEYGPDDIDFNRISRVNYNVWFLDSITN